MVDVIHQETIPPAKVIGQQQYGFSLLYFYRVKLHLVEIPLYYPKDVTVKEPVDEFIFLRIDHFDFGLRNSISDLGVRIF